MSNKSLMRFLSLLFILVALSSCNQSQDTSVTVNDHCDNGEILAEDHTCVNSTFYSNLTDEQISNNGGTVELTK